MGNTEEPLAQDGTLPTQEELTMVQVRKPAGKFGGRATDIKKSDVNNAIRLVVEEQADVAMRIKKPVKVNANLDASVHVYHHTENDEFFFKVSMAILALSGAAFLIWWMVIR
jgi:hypothetical protein